MRTSSYVLLASMCLSGWCLSGSGLAAPTLSFSGSCDGEATATVTDAGNYRLVFGLPGTYAVPMGACAGTEMGITGGSISAILTASETSFALSSTHCGLSAQAIDVDSCEVSEAMMLLVPPGCLLGFDEGRDDLSYVGFNPFACVSFPDWSDPNARFEDWQGSGYHDGLAALECDLHRPDYWPRIRLVTGGAGDWSLYYGGSFSQCRGMCAEPGWAGRGCSPFCD